MRLLKPQTDPQVDAEVRVHTYQPIGRTFQSMNMNVYPKREIKEGIKQKGKTTNHKSINMSS